LKLDNCNIECNLPIARLSSIRKLEYTGMTDLPDDLWQLPDLRELDVSYCRNLHHIPDDIPADAKLESLSLQDVEIRRIPSSLCALSNLTRLDIIHCETNALPDDFWRLTSLRILSIEETPITRLPPNMERLVNLQEVHLKVLSDFNIGGAFSQPMPAMRWLEIDSVANVDTTDMSGLTGLTELRIELREHQSQLHPSIGSLGSLQRLELKYGGLTALPAEIGQLTNLTALHLHITVEEFTIPEAIGGLVRLQDFYVHGHLDQWLYLPPAIQLLTSLTSLCVFGGFDLPASLTALSRLRELNIDCPERPQPALRNMPSLRRLMVNIPSNVTDRRVGEMLAHATGLTFLLVERSTYNDLAPVMAAFPTLTNLRELYFMLMGGSDEPGLPVLDIPSSVANLSRLTQLRHVSPRNAIPPGIFQLTALQVLRLEVASFRSPDRMERLSPDVTNLVNLRHLQLPAKHILLCPQISRLSKLTSVQLYEDRDHQAALEALRVRGVAFMNDVYPW
jgi:Leucine-rich repeat (LRR) protein